MENANFHDLLKEHVELKGFTAKKLAELTSIPERYITALLDGQDRVLPAAPYVRGYIAKLSSVVDLDKDAMCRLYQSAARVQRSGQLDRLPSNRFVIKTIDKRWLIGGLVGLFLVFYLGTNVYQMFNAPDLKIIFPSAESLIWESPTITLRGILDSVNILTINGVEVYVGRDGKFEKEYTLQPGLNTIEFIAKKFLGKETKVVRQIILNNNQTNYEQTNE